MSNHTQVLIIGAGIAGLAAARRLADANVPTIVLDKGRGISGRMATRRVGDATFDHGAQYFSAKTPVFQQFIEKAAETGGVQKWWPDIGDSTHPRWIGTAGMNAVPKLLAENISILKNKRVVQIMEIETGWQVQTEDGDSFKGSALLVTMPAPQAIRLLENSGIGLPGNPLRNIAYHPCLVVMAKLDQPSGIPAPGGLQVNGNVVSWLADNFQKGISKTPSLTIHASPEFSTRHLEGDLQAAGQLMLDASSSSFLQPAKVLDWQIHRWRYSLCYQRHEEPFWQADTDAPLLFGGDGFGMGNVEGAFLSGVGMAEKVLSKL